MGGWEFVAERLCDGSRVASAHGKEKPASLCVAERRLTAPPSPASQSELYHQTITSISTFDDHALARKIYGLSGETVIEATLVCDSDRKIFAETSAYGDGLQEITAGSYSDTQTTEKTMVYRNGLLYLTREVKTRPVKPQ
jgi:hypothetical protein